MPKNPSPQTRTIAALDVEIAEADALRVRLTQHARRYRNAGEAGPHCDQKAAAFLAAWRQQREVELLQLERAAIDLDAWEQQTPPSDAQIAELSRALDESKARYQSARGTLFAAREARREHEQRGTERRQNLARVEYELRRTDAEIATREATLSTLAA